MPSQTEKTVEFFFSKCKEQGHVEQHKRMALLQKWTMLDILNEDEFAKIAAEIVRFGKPGTPQP